MFPSQQDVEAFQSKFGAESILRRMTVPIRSYCGTQTAVVITPAHTKEATLRQAWELVRAVARWILVRATELPPTERYEITVAWSQSVSRLQGQIFKVAGDQATIRGIADSTDWREYEHALRHHWEKDVFANRVV